MCSEPLRSHEKWARTENRRPVTLTEESFVQFMENVTYVPLSQGEDWRSCLLWVVSFLHQETFLENAKSKVTFLLRTHIFPSSSHVAVKVQV